MAAGYKVSSLDDLDYWGYKETQTGRVRHELGITAFGVNSWLGPNVGDRVIPEHAEDQEGDQDELYVVVRGRARFEVGGDTVDAPQGALVYVPAGPTVRTAFAEEPGTTIVSVGGTPGKPYDPVGWELWAPLRPLYEAGDYDAVVERGRALVEANPQYALLFYNLACCESLAGRTTDALEHLRRAAEMSEQLRDYAKGDSDFDAIREDTAFKEVVGS